MAKYGLPRPQVNGELYNFLLKHVNTKPIRVYAIAASALLEEICILASEQTLPLSLSFVSEADAIQMGPIYLRRLFFLHLGRRSALQRVMSTPPSEHTASPECSEAQRQTVHRMWKAGEGEVLAQELPQCLTAVDLVAVFGPFVGELTCAQCRGTLQERITALVHDWSRIKRTI